MHLYLALPTCSADLFASAVQHDLQSASGPVQVLAWANGLDPATLHRPSSPHRLSVGHAPLNIGVVPALQRLYEMACAEDEQQGREDSIVGYVHDDLHLLEAGWDRRFLSAFDDPQVMLAGVAGGLLCGRADVHAEPFDPHRVFYRGEGQDLFFSHDIRHGHQWGRLVAQNRDVAVLDGMALFVRRRFLDFLGGWTWWPTFHHGYDLAIGLEVLRAGYRTQLVPVRSIHWEARTSKRAAYQALAGARHGGDGALFGQAMLAVRERYADLLPVDLRRGPARLTPMPLVPAQKRADPLSWTATHRAPAAMAALPSPSVPFFQQHDEPPAFVAPSATALSDAFHRAWYEDDHTWKQNTWAGFPIAQLPSDMQIYQEIFFETKPAFVVQTGVLHGGSLLFFAHLLDLLGASPKAVVIGVDLEITPQARSLAHPRIRLVQGDSVAPATRDQVEALLPPGPRGLVSLDSLHAKAHVQREIELYSPLVAVGSYLVVEDTNINGHPVLPAYGPGPFEAVEAFFASGSCPFVQDDRWKRMHLSFHHAGWLRRVA